MRAPLRESSSSSRAALRARRRPGSAARSIRASPTRCARSSAARPFVDDVTPDAVAAYGRDLERHGGRGGGKASPATRRAHLTMLRALLKELGRGGDATAVRVPSHRLGPPETLSAVDTVAQQPERELGKFLRRYAKAAGIPDRLAHPHALRGFYPQPWSRTGCRSSASRPVSGTRRSRRPPAASPSSPSSTRTRRQRRQGPRPPPPTPRPQLVARSSDRAIVPARPPRVRAHESFVRRRPGLPYVPAPLLPEGRICARRSLLVNPQRVKPLQAR